MTLRFDEWQLFPAGSVAAGNELEYIAFSYWALGGDCTVK
jgi:hypothetical protein